MDLLLASVDNLLNAQVGKDSMEVHGNYKTAWLAHRLIQTERAALLAQLQAAKGCPNCVVSQDGKSLEIPPVPEKNPDK